MASRAELIFGKLAITHKFLTIEQVNECLDIQKKMLKFGTGGKKIGEIAVERGYLSTHQLGLLLKMQATQAAELKKKEEEEEKKRREEEERRAEELRRRQQADDEHRRADEDERRRREELAARNGRPMPRPAAKPVSEEEPKKAAPASARVKSVEARPAARPAPVVSRTAAHDEGLAEAIRLRKMKAIFAFVLVLVLIVVGLVVVTTMMKSAPPSRTAGATGPQLPDSTDKPPVAADPEKEASKRLERVRAYVANPENKEDLDYPISKLKEIISLYPSAKSAGEAKQLLIDLERKQQAKTGHAPGIPSGQPWDALYSDLVKEATQFEQQGKLWAAVKVWDKWPKDYIAKAPEQTSEIERQKQKALDEIEKRKGADLGILSAYQEKRQFEQAKELMAKMQEYLSPDAYSELAESHEKFIRGLGQDEGPDKVDKSPMEIATDRFSQYRMLREGCQFSKSYNALKEAGKVKQFVDSSAEYKDAVEDMEAISTVLRSAATYINAYRGQQMTIRLNGGANVVGKVERVEETRVYIETFTGKTNFDVGEIVLSNLVTMARSNMDTSKPADLIKIGVFYLEFGDVQNAKQSFTEAERRGGQVPLRYAKAAMGEGKSVASTPARWYEEGKKAFESSDYETARSRFSNLLGLYRESDVVKQNIDEINNMLAECDKKLSITKSLFSSKQVELEDDGTLNITYDFSSKNQLNDWTTYYFPVIGVEPKGGAWAIAEDELSGKGCLCLLWKGQITGDVTVEFDAYCKGNPVNILATICDDGEDNYYLFGAPYKETGPPKFTIRLNRKGQGRNFISDKESPNLAAGQRYHVKIEKTGKDLSLSVDGAVVASGSDTKLALGRIGFAALAAEVRLDNIVISGKLSKTWLQKEKEKFSPGGGK
jgi:hypothetical protein